MTAAIECHGLTRRYGARAAVNRLDPAGAARAAARRHALLGAAFVLGDAASARRTEVAATVEAAHQAERTRIARELHDVVAHHRGAGGGRRALLSPAVTRRLLVQPGNGMG